MATTGDHETPTATISNDKTPTTPTDGDNKVCMVKGKGKGKAAASSSPPKAEEATGNGANDTTISIESVKMDEAAEATIPPVGETEGDMKEEVKDDSKAGSASKKKAKRLRQKKKKAATAAAPSNVTDKPGTSAADQEDVKKKDSMGLIFMCSSKTKKDCYQYKVFGLPASKKEAVAKVYKGMRLFLFDIDLRLMYGIYKAASPGGYNIEPKAFKSAFPSQVRFAVLNDCLPLPEEKFKVAIKDNYYGKNKFNCELSAEQVKNLCKLFRNANSKAPKSKQLGGARRAAPVPSSIDRGRKRRPFRDTVRHPMVGGSNGFFPRAPALYEREAYASPPPRPAALPPPSYPYDRPADDYYYRRERLLELREQRIMDLEMRPRDPIEYRDPYPLYREPVPYRESLYPSGLPAEYHVPPPSLYRY